jgi:anti-anti-sigma regulatory factor
VTSQPSAGSTARGVVRLLNTAGGRVLCLAGAVDEEVVERYLRCYGREPARIEVVDAGSVTFLSASGLDLVRDHLDAAAAAGRAVAVRPSPQVAALLAAGGTEGLRALARRPAGEGP